MAANHAAANQKLHSLSHVKGAPCFSFGSKSPGNRPQDSPGPGAYTQNSENHRTCKRTPQFSFGSAPRDSNRELLSPGPGEYSPPSSSSGNLGRNAAKFGFGTSKRRDQPSRADQPGPGAYQIKGPMGTSGPMHTTAGKRLLNNSMQTPGPGSYSVAVSHTTSTQAKATPKWGFGTSDRERKVALDVPGPGAYNHDNSSAGGARYTFRPKPRFSPPVSSPGPGEYGVNHSQFVSQFG